MTPAYRKTQQNNKDIKVFFTSGQNWMILAWTGGELWRDMWKME